MTKKEEFFKSCIVLDTETTDINPKEAEVIEFGFVVNNDGEWTEHNHLFKPYGNIVPEVSEVTFITNKMVENSPYFEENIDFYNKTYDCIGPNCVRVAHNANYDATVLEKYSSLNNLSTEWICTYRMAKKLYHNDDSIKYLRLSYLRFYFDLDVPDTIVAHRAGSDSYVCAKLLEHMVGELEERGIIDTDVDYAPQIESWLKEPVKIEVFPIGKHKGKSLDDIPTNYYMWAIGNMDMFNEESTFYDNDLAQSVASVLEGRNI